MSDCGYGRIQSAYEGTPRCIEPPVWIDVSPLWQTLGHTSAIQGYQTQPKDLRVRNVTPDSAQCGPYRSVQLQSCNPVGTVSSSKYNNWF